MFRTFIIVAITALLVGCNSQHVGHGLGATTPVYIPAPPQESGPIMIIGPNRTIICNRVGNLITCY